MTHAKRKKNHQSIFNKANYQGIANLETTGHESILHDPEQCSTCTAAAGFAPDVWLIATEYLEKDRRAHVRAHGWWHLDPGKLEASFEKTGLLHAFETLREALKEVSKDRQGVLDGEEHATDCNVHTHKDGRACNCYISRSVEILKRADRALVLSYKVKP